MRNNNDAERDNSGSITGVGPRSAAMFAAIHEWGEGCEQRGIEAEREAVVLYGRGYASGWDGEGARAVNAFLDDIAEGVHREQA